MSGCPQDSPDSSQFAGVDATGTAADGTLVDGDSAADGLGSIDTSQPGDAGTADAGTGDAGTADGGSPEDGASDTTGDAGVDTTPTDTATPADTAAVDSGPPPKPKAIRIAAGGDTSCAILDNGTVRCWGRGGEGQLGNGKSGGATKSSTPVLVSGVAGATDIACSAEHCCAVTGGTLACWGQNDFNQVSPNAPTKPQPTPLVYPDLTGITAVAVASRSTCVLIDGGAVKCWGLGAAGQLGDGQGKISKDPVLVTDLDQTLQIVGGTNHFCARTVYAEVWCWGVNSEGQLGDGAGGTSKDSTTAVRVTGLTNATDLSSGAAHVCAITSGADAGLWCWGKNNSHQIGTGGGNTFTATAKKAFLGFAATDVCAGDGHTCAQAPDGDPWCWGANSNGQTGGGVPPYIRDTPAAVPEFAGIVEIVEVAAGSSHGCARTVDGHVWCWGANGAGQTSGPGATSQFEPFEAL